MEITAFSDERGNRIEWAGKSIPQTSVIFTGSNNTLRIDPEARLGRLSVQFDCDNGVMEIGSSRGVPAFSGTVRIGQDSRVIVGKNVSTTGAVGISATEGTTVQLGEDCMIAIGVQLRADDGHPIFDVHTTRRVNVSRDITIGEHVWLGYGSTVLGGATIASGSVIGFGAIVTRSIPNNAVAVGNPAKVVRRHIAWERPHLSLVKPYYKPDASSVQRTRWWARTSEGAAPEPVATPSLRSIAPSRFRSALRSLRPKK